MLSWPEVFNITLSSKISYDWNESFYCKLMSFSLYFSFYILEIKLRSFTFQTSSLFLNFIQSVFLNVGFETESSCINRVGLEHTLHLCWPWTYDPPASGSQMHVLTEMHQQFLLLCMPETKIKANCDDWLVGNSVYY